MSIELTHERGPGEPSAAPPVPQKLAELPTPPAVSKRARQYQRQLGLLGPSALSQIEEELKLQYYYGGRHIRCLATPQGRVVVAVHNGNDEDYQRQLQALSPLERQRAVALVPSRWDDETSEVLGSAHHES
jgi:hypothetical protein